jgi:signal transduction histidine kinase
VCQTYTQALKMRSSKRKSAPRKASARVEPAKPAKNDANHDDVMQLRSLAHDLSNSLEAILQAAYLLGRSKLDSDGRRWIELIDTASQDAARTNREIRKVLRSLCGE